MTGRAHRSDQPSTTVDEPTPHSDMAAALQQLFGLLQHAQQRDEQILLSHQQLVDRLDSLAAAVAGLCKSERTELACVSDQVNGQTTGNPPLPTPQATVTAPATPSRETTNAAKAPASSWEEQKAKWMSMSDGDHEMGRPPDPEDAPNDTLLAASPDTTAPSAAQAVPETQPNDHELQDLDEACDDPRVVDLRRRWEEKLRQAEIEISIERARISRMQSELEAQLAEHRQRLQQAGDARESKAAGKSPLARLARFLPKRV